MQSEVSSYQTPNADGTPQSCFIAGTMLAVKGGQKPIELLSEGDKVLTDAETNAFGTASDEHVCKYLASGVLCGISKFNT